MLYSVELRSRASYWKSGAKVRHNFGLCKRKVKFFSKKCYLSMNRVLKSCQPTVIPTPQGFRGELLCER